MEQEIQKVRFPIVWSPPLGEKDISSLPIEPAIYTFILFDEQGPGIVKFGAARNQLEKATGFNNEIWENKNLRIVYSIIPYSFKHVLEGVLDPLYPKQKYDMNYCEFWIAKALRKAYVKKQRRIPLACFNEIPRGYPIKHIELEETGTLKIMEIKPARITSEYANNFRKRTR